MMKLRRISIFTLLLSGFLLASCGRFAIPTTEEEAPTPAVSPSAVLPVATATPTATPFFISSPTAFPTLATIEEDVSLFEPTATPVAVADSFAIPTATPFPEYANLPPDIRYNGVAFSYLNRLDYARILPETVLPNPRQPGIGVDRGNPAYTRFAFGSATPSDNFFRPTEPQIRIYEIASYSELFPEINIEIAKLDSLLIERPTRVVSNTLPLLPLIGLSETFHSQLDYVSFQDGLGQGVRYIAQYDQIAGPITNAGLFYTFQGITADRQHYVTAFFPVRLDFLPETFEAADLTPFQFESTKAEYYASIQSEIETLTVGDFEPSLAVYDDVVRSIAVGLPPEETVVTAAEPEPLSAEIVVQENTSPPTADGLTSVIRGEIRFPGGLVPFMRIYAVSTDGTKFYFTELLESPSYRLPVSAGTYELFAYVIDDLQAGGYTTYVTCTELFRGDCGDQLLLPVVVGESEDVNGAHIADWDITDYRFPLPPDELSVRVQGLRVEAAGQVPDEYGTVTGPIFYPENPVPPIRVYAQNLATGEVFNQQLGGGDNSYSIRVPPGTYVIYGYAFAASGAVSGGGYTNGDSGLIPVTVAPAETVIDATLGHWNQPPLGFIPAAPGFSASPTRP